MKLCRVCNTNKHETLFSKRTASWDGLSTTCKACYAEYYKKYIPKYKKRASTWGIRTPGARQGISLKQYWPHLHWKEALVEYNNLVDKQNNLCRACNFPETLKHYKTGKLCNLCVDHCHITGKIRGLLCRRCNRVLGLMKENISAFMGIIYYMKETE